MSTRPQNEGLPRRRKRDLRILMLEDSVRDAALIERELRRGGMSFSARRVDTREAFLGQLIDFEPDLVLSDYKLPSFDGLQALEIVRARSSWLPFILVSGHIGEELATEALKIGATDFILKDRLGRLVPCVQRSLREIEVWAERKRLEERFRLIVEAMPNAIVIINPEGQIEMVNAQTELAFGYLRAELLGRPMEMLVPERLRSDHPERRSSIFSIPQPQPIGVGRDLFGLRHDGSEFPVEIGLSPIETEEGVLVLSVIVDTTERREIELEKEQKQTELRAANTKLERLAQHLAMARNAAERANRAKSHFLAGMSHELRTPLNGILGYARLLRMEGGLNAVQSARVEAMLDAGTHLLEMIHCVLDLSEIETARAELQIADVDLHRVAHACLDLVRPTATAKNLALSLSISLEVPQHVVLDPTRLRQVLLNLLGNAIKFTAEGAVELRLQTTADGTGLRFEVADTGPGIPVEQRHRLFQNFERLGAGTTGTIEGAGLGLSLSAQLAALMGGLIGQTNNPGGGSVFWLELPLVASTTATPLPAEAVVSEVAVSSLARGLRVLVVDDVLMNREIAGSFLRAAGCEVTCVEGGAEAIAAVAVTDFNVVLMDVRMPEMDGLEATRRIRALKGSHGQVPIVALTAQAFAEQIQECRKAGMDGHLAKPFDPDQLLTAVVRAAATGRAHSESLSPVSEPTFVHAALILPVLGPDLPVLDPMALERAALFLSPEVVDSYLRIIAEGAEALLRGLHRPNALARSGDELAATAHTLAGSAGLFGFERLAVLGLRFERAVRSGASEVPMLAAGLSAALGVTLQAIYDRSSAAVEA
jgi:PAS domain S-box-containing protein